MSEPQSSGPSSESQAPGADSAPLADTEQEQDPRSKAERVEDLDQAQHATEVL